MPGLDESMRVHIPDVIGSNRYMQKHRHGKARIVVGVYFAIDDDSVYEKLSPHAKQNLRQPKPDDSRKHDRKDIKRIRQESIDADASQPVQRITIRSLRLVIPSDVEDCRESSGERVLFELMHQQSHEAEQKNFPEWIDLVSPKAHQES